MSHHEKGDNKSERPSSARSKRPHDKKAPSEKKERKETEKETKEETKEEEGVKAEVEEAEPIAEIHATDSESEVRELTCNRNNNLDFYVAHSPEIQIKALYNTNMHKKLN